MGIFIDRVEWVDKSDKLDDLLRKAALVTTEPMEQGFEAEVIKINIEKESYVWKVWNKRSKPDIRFQFHLLNALYQQGVSVSKPVGWGIDANADHVLLTTFDGIPVHKLSDQKMTEMAKLLAHIHRIRVEELGNLRLPQHDFIDYFYPGVKEHADIYQAVTSLVPLIPIKQDCIIHGDFHLKNILEEQDRITVIDWTNAQIGDARYDFVWSLILMKLYIPERYAAVFRSAYLLEHPIQEKELAVFEALACLRWTLLNRYGGTPSGPDTIERLKSLVTHNPFLQECGFTDIPIKNRE
ncbi:aminoglycoside phosphotransferase family protein [Brevibacillus ruminantium]|uniref:Aminoglycoside phosphotransferase family protein n=1 Tax=Brevibacillus ruminantium TaxID=2950604 RepID=A0ABY4WHN6_9BACL|nr:aminoglycoside phosphotransferase family protein [Brevibacillus ruminantium]USG66573.1 aminoglycoside phosphotransferase family protein [Brevibacillus ruminantium]